MAKDEVHNRLFKIIIFGLAACIGYTEIRIQILQEWIKGLELRFNEHQQLSSHEGQSQATQFLKDLVYFIMNEIGLKIN